MTTSNKMPDFTIGILGGGQLGRMMAVAAKHMGYRIVVLDPTEDCPAAQVGDKQIVAAYDDMAAIRELSESSDVVTYEFENVDLEAARFLENAGRLPQGARALEITQDREREKNIMVELGLPVGKFSIISSPDQVTEAIGTIGFPAVLKTCTGGYDGKGQMKVDGPDDLDAAAAFVEEKGRSILEEWISFDKEISVVFTRSSSGDITCFPLAENEHRNHILHRTTAPATVSSSISQKALEAAKLVGEGVGVVGTFAIEMFLEGENLYINEMAPRPHNSGHYTIEACNVSQFEQHIRAITGASLIPIAFHGAAVMTNLLGDDMEPFTKGMARKTDGHVHIYGKKEIKANRKMGHITYTGKNIEDVSRMAGTKKEVK